MRKVSSDEKDFIETSLMDLRIQLDNIKTFLDTKSWINESKESSKQKAFEFQSKLFDKYQVWLEKYMNLSGVVDYYNEAHKDKGEKLRKGYVGNELMEMLQKGELDNNGN